MDDRTLYIIDRVVLRPGTARAFLDAYLTGYVPGARERGLTLERILVSPPVWIEGEPNTVTATWTVRGPSEWWAAAVRGRHDPGPARWWESMAPMIAERSRSTAAHHEDVAGLCDV
ncbi:hypothetical protein IU436_17275 [Nocardia farcinica]|uniref:hypothetical protein n=1 Tax=Nocardia farcinica TaxID=37329 RepID=UPI0018950E46|nr:hypothetical protein [Nocardia farcinica]MBF6141979.1 hypothetical protein [Nocardia farcinica]MBF6266882.1 hypothetical protein [Nocardia farcinica]MBF6293975.1 hypothetical protein [Nocardia farcinica]MBF6375254.1 hypothetical protein [Nocardia farcinica]MBF6380799.1 hypothetical protein [Nocardia farcinica]